MSKETKDKIIKPLEGSQYDAIRSNADYVVMSGAGGGGKPLNINELALTPSGWKRMGDVRVGDVMVSPFHNNPSTVTGVYPQGVIPTYRLITSDGRSVLCGQEHLWMVRTKKQIGKARKGVTSSRFIKTTQQLIDEFISLGKDIYLPLPNTFDGIEKELPVHPYVLGIFIGDGNKSNTSFLISNDEEDIIEKCARLLDSNYSLHKSYSYTNRIMKNERTDSVRKYLESEGLMDYSRNRFIPKIYLSASKEQRLELLKGLMDSDGNVDVKNRFTFSTTSPKLKDTFIELCRSLGYIATANEDKRNKYLSGHCYKICIHTNDVIFSSKKNMAKYYDNVEKYQKYNTYSYHKDHVRITSIEYVGETDCVCISVDDPDRLFITTDYIVTHNTFSLGYAPLNYLYENPGAKMVWFMRNVSDFFDAGKVVDGLKEIYPLIDRRFKINPKDPIGEVIKNQEDMGVKFYNASEIKFQQLNNENPTVVDKIFKGLQFKKAIFEECNKFEWRTISTCQTRLRANTKGKAQIYLAQNPERECFIRQLCGCGKNGGGWIGDDGRPIKEMNGVVRFFHIVKGDLEQVYWGATKEEVYLKCKGIIDALLKTDPDMHYEDFIMSMVFFTFDVRDNKAMLEANKGYRAMTATSVLADSMHEPNWNFSILDEKEEDLDADCEITHAEIAHMFRPTTYTLNKRRITVDVATTGEDNMVMKYWEGFHCLDMEYSEKNSNFEMVKIIKNFMQKHDCTDRELIIDVQGNGFLKEIFNLSGAPAGGYAFSGATAPSNKGKRLYERSKDEAAHLAMQMIKAGLITYEPSLAKKKYTHQKLKREGATTILKHLQFESTIFKFDKLPSGRLQFQGKKTQHALIKGFSPDLTDNIIMLCGALCYDCYRALAIETGEARKKADMDSLLKAMSGQEDIDTEPKRKKITNSRRILDIIGSI